MTREKLDYILRIVLTALLFLVPIVFTCLIWCIPEVEASQFIIGLSTVNVILSVAEALFLVKAAIFPKDGKKWWKDDK